MKRYWFIFSVYLVLWITPIWGQTLKTEVIDVGGGLCTLTELPNGKFLMYDAGTDLSSRGKIAREELAERLDSNSIIELLILSHMDADHIYAAVDVLTTYKVIRIAFTGYGKSKAYRELKGRKKQDTKAFQELLKKVEELSSKRSLTVIGLNQNSRQWKVHSWSFDQVKVDILCGFASVPGYWQITDPTHAVNAVSIVMRLEYQGKSILFCGDAVGRHIGDSDEVCLATEKYLLDSVARSKLDVDVIIAPHHGADNASCSDFIQATSPQYVIFSAGTRHNHPTKQAIERYIKYGSVQVQYIFRTDRGEGWVTSSTAYNSGEIVEWNGQAIKGCKDTWGDDTVMIKVNSSGILKVNYVNNDPCNQH